MSWRLVRPATLLVAVILTVVGCGPAVWKPPAESFRAYPARPQKVDLRVALRVALDALRVRAEAFLERPSAQDLMVTPILGLLAGAFVFEPVRDWVKQKRQFQWYDHALLIVTDPLGTLNSVFERLLGIKSEILLRPSPPSVEVRWLGAGERGRTGPRAQGFSASIDVVWE